MNKHFMLIILMVCFWGCKNGWDEADRQEFMSDCQITKGTEKECLCVLNCLESEYASYQEALNNIPVSVSNTNFKDCISQCE